MSATNFLGGWREQQGWPRNYGDLGWGTSAIAGQEQPLMHRGGAHFARPLKLITGGPLTIEVPRGVGTTPLPKSQKLKAQEASNKNMRSREQRPMKFRVGLVGL